MPTEAETQSAYDKFRAAWSEYVEFVSPVGNGKELYIVLNDHETFTSLAGCNIIECPDKWDTSDIECALDHDDDGGKLNLTEMVSIVSF